MNKVLLLHQQKKKLSINILIIKYVFGFVWYRVKMFTRIIFLLQVHIWLPLPGTNRQELTVWNIDIIADNFSALQLEVTWFHSYFWIRLLAVDDASQLEGNFTMAKCGFSGFSFVSFFSARWTCKCHPPQLGCSMIFAKCCWLFSFFGLLFINGIVFCRSVFFFLVWEFVWGLLFCSLLFGGFDFWQLQSKYNCWP